MSDLLKTKLEKIKDRYRELNELLIDESVLGDQKKLQKFAKELWSRVHASAKVLETY